MDNILQTLGLAYKGKRILLSEEILNVLYSKKVKLIILANDASSNTKKRFIDKAKYYNVAYLELFTKSELGRALGKDEVAAIGVLDEALKNKIINY